VYHCVTRVPRALSWYISTSLDRLLTPCGDRMAGLYICVTTAVRETDAITLMSLLYIVLYLMTQSVSSLCVKLLLPYLPAKSA